MSWLEWKETPEGRFWSLLFVPWEEREKVRKDFAAKGITLGGDWALSKEEYDTLIREGIDRQQADLFDLREYTEKTFQKDCEIWAKMKSTKEGFYTKEEFDQELEKAAGRPATRYVSTADHVAEAEWQMAVAVNPLETYKAWHTPVCMGGYDYWKHSRKYHSKRQYYVNKAIACGIAKTAEEAEDYFQKNK